MRVSQLFGETLREAPADAKTASHQLLVRAGYIRQLAPGTFALTPLGKRAIDKMSAQLGAALAEIGGQEMLLPTLLPADFAERANFLPGTLLATRKDENSLLTESAEALVAALCVSDVRSYRQLPQLLWQLRSVIRDEKRVSGGLLRTREFLLHSVFSLDRDAQALQKQYLAIRKLFEDFFKKIELPVQLVEASPEIFGGSLSHEFVFLSPNGDDTAVFCDNCGTAAKREIARFRKKTFADAPPKPLEKVHTPATASIEELSKFLEINPRQTAKMVFFWGNFGKRKPEKLIVCVIRGDMETSDALVRQLSGAHALRPAEPEEIAAVGCVPGFASAIGIDREKALVIADELIATSANLVTGANETDYHLLNSNYGRDYTADIVGHIALPPNDACCENCGEPLRSESCVEIASLRDLGTFFSEAFNAAFLDENGKPQPIFMGSYGIGISRLLACLAEAHHDDFGLRLPRAVAPFDIAIVQLKGEASASVAEKLYADLKAAEFSVLLDDRNASPGVKFNDADLRGMPLRITVSERALAQGGVEAKLRSATDRELVPLDQLPGFIKNVFPD